MKHFRRVVTPRISDVNKGVFTLKKEKKLSFVSEMGLFSAVDDAKTIQSPIFVTKKELKTRPISSSFSYLRKR